MYVLEERVVDRGIGVRTCVVIDRSCICLFLTIFIVPTRLLFARLLLPPPNDHHCHHCHHCHHSHTGIGRWA
jgi:hypothetical protein